MFYSNNTLSNLMGRNQVLLSTIISKHRCISSFCISSPVRLNRLDSFPFERKAVLLHEKYRLSQEQGKKIWKSSIQHTISGRERIMAGRFRSGAIFFKVGAQAHRQHLHQEDRPVFGC